MLTEGPKEQHHCNARGCDSPIIIISCLGSTIVVYALKIEIMYINYNTTRSKTCTDNVIVIIVDFSPRLRGYEWYAASSPSRAFLRRGFDTMEAQVIGALEAI